MANFLSLEKRTQIVNLLVEGVGVNATARIVGCSKPAVLRNLTRLGKACAKMHNERVRGLTPETIQTDEVWAFNYCKQKRVKTAKNAPGAAGDCWLWTAITDTKLIASYRVGLRTQDDANEFMLDLAGRVLNRVQLSTDAYSQYEDAVINAFGFEIDYGQIRKVFASEQEGKGAERKYSPGQCCKTLAEPILGMPERARISTSHIERSNLTLRMGLRRYTRLTNAHSKKIDNHINAVHIFMAYYNWCRPHESLDGDTPAMASGLADRKVTLEELVEKRP